MIDEINTKVEEIIKEIEKFALTLEFEEICEFSMEEDEDLDKKIPQDKLEKSGIYLIEIKNNGNWQNFSEWIEDFKKKWEDERYKKKSVPNIIQKRIKTHKELQDWIPLYIGKSKNIFSRFSDHIFKELDKTRSALKLKERENLKGEIYKLSIIHIPNKNYDFIVPFIERQLRDKINPIIGKQ